MRSPGSKRPRVHQVRHDSVTHQRRVLALGDLLQRWGRSLLLLPQHPTPVPTNQDAFRDFANDLHRRLALASLAYDTSHQGQEVEFNTSDLERLVALAQAVGPTARIAALEAAEALDAARSALRTPPRGTHAEQVDQIRRTNQAVTRGATLLNHL
jgi:hypothetical protein